MRKKLYILFNFVSQYKTKSYNIWDKLIQIFMKLSEKLFKGVLRWFNTAKLTKYSQKPQMSSKYGCVLDAHLIILGSCKSAYNSRMAYYGNPWCQNGYQRWPNPSKLQSGATNVLQAWVCSWCTFNHTRELKSGILVNNYIKCLFVLSNLIANITQSSKTPVRNNQCPQSVMVFLMYFKPC